MKKLSGMRKLARTLLASPSTWLVTLIVAGLLFGAPSASRGTPSGMVLALPAAAPPSGLTCSHHRLNGHGTATACWDIEDDNFWVKDEYRDGYSAVASWRNPAEPPALSDSGYCRSELEAGHWGYCHIRASTNGVMVWGAGIYDGNGHEKWPARFQDWQRETL